MTICPTGSYSESGSCSLCSAGTYNSLPGQASCTPCIAGKYSTAIGANFSATCKNCPFGTWSSLGANSSSSCVSTCSAGYACTSNQNMTICGSGTFSANGSGTCSSCVAGSWSVSGAASCNFCAAGSWGDQIGATSIATCNNCTAGTWNNITGSTSIAACNLCPAGTWSNVNGSSSITACNNCSAGTYSNLTGQTAITKCISSMPGTFSESGAPTFTSCLAGSYNSISGGTSIAACFLCPLGTASNIVGATKSTDCKPCAAGQYAGIASPVCSNCLLGTYSNIRASFCNACPTGWYCPTTLLALPCPAGRYGLSENVTNLSNCTICPAGTFNKNTGAKSSTFCDICGMGSFSGGGASTCTPCPAGTANPTVAATSNASCISCEAGRYSSFSAQAFCSSSCLAGFYGSKTNGVSAIDACVACSPGSYTSSSASSSCTLCGTGHYTSSNQSTSCIPCPFHTYLDFTGGTSKANCTGCPNGLKTSVQGAIAVFQCVFVTYVCASGMQPASAKVPLSADDCLPLICPSHLIDTPSASGCSGCPFGSSGFAPICSTCLASELCPGFLPQPLPAHAGLLIAPLSSLAANVAPTCTSAALVPRVIIALTPGPYSFVSIQPLSAIIIGAGLMIISLFLTAVPRAHTKLEAIDSFATAHSLKKKEAFINDPTPLGGACTIASILAFLTAATILIIGYASSNSFVTSTLDTATSQASPFTNDIVWATLPSSTSTSGTAKLLPPLPLSTSLQVRIFSPVGLNCSSPQQNLIASDPGWTTRAISDCGDGRSLLTFTCTSCALSISSALTITLPFTCQSLYVEAIAIDAIGEMNVLQLPTASSTAIGSQLLTAITWTLSPMASIYKDTIADKKTRGFRLLTSTAIPSYSLSNATLLPLASAVVLTINFPLQTTFAVTTLTQSQTLVELVTSIIGLLGIMGAFKMLFQMAESNSPLFHKCLQRMRGGGRTLKSLVADPAEVVKVEDGHVAVVENPMKIVRNVQSHELLEPNVFDDEHNHEDHSNKWVAVVEANGDVWYDNIMRDETTWVLPAGSIVVRRVAAAGDSDYGLT
jgi:hypothetical protein